ncbi:hypothetical protein [Acidovorax temperans]|uniref:hypothetical protein n=1 Tax=Acidovorax temperans TaxID=80878 RepID=UPI0030CD6BEE
MTASVLATGDVAIVSFESDLTAGAVSTDALRFVLLKPIGSGTVIYFSDRTWNGTAFPAAGGGEGTFTYTTGVDLPAGTVVTVTGAQLTAAGITLSNAGETIYVYQGTDANTPTRFLHAVEMADGNAAFNGVLTNTGLVNGTSAVALTWDNGSYAGSPTAIAQAQFKSINTASHWHGSDQDDIGGTANYTEVIDTTVATPFFGTPDMVMIAAMAGGGQSDAILRIGRDGSESTGANLTRLFRDNPAFSHITDVAFDLESGFFFVLDSDGNFVNRILRGNVADLVSGNNNPSLTPLFATDGKDNGVGAENPGEIISGIELNTLTNKVYWIDGDFLGSFEGGWEVRSMNYDGTGQAVVAVIDTENSNGTPFGVTGVGDYAVRNLTNTMYVVASMSGIDGFGNATVYTNHILSVNLTTGAIATLPLGAADARSDTGGGTYDDGRLVEAEGQIVSLDVDQNTGVIYFVTQPISATDSGGIFSYDPVTDTLVELWNQPPNAAHNTLQPFPTSNLTHIEFDEVGGRYYVSATSDTDTEHDGTPGTNESDASIFIGPVGHVGAPTLFVRAYEPTANGAPQGMEIDYAPVTVVTAAGATYTETAGSPSAAGTPVAVITDSAVTDPDQATIWGATVAITQNFVPGDTLSFTAAGGISGTYDVATGLLSLTGSASLAAYQTALNSVRYANAGDNPTNYGAATSRTISFTTFDGLATSDPVTATVTVVGVNDAPVNNNGGTVAAMAEDSFGNAAGAPPSMPSRGCRCPTPTPTRRCTLSPSR